jgi:hypothetical protein
MRFKIKPGYINENMSIVYRKNEYSFDAIPKPEGGVSSILLNDIQLEIDTEGRILYIWGLSPYTSWISVELSPPSGKKGIINVELDKDVIPGVAVRIGEVGEWPVFHDDKLGWICIGNAVYTNQEETIELCADCRLVINDDNLVALWIHPKWC